jgi:integrase
VDGFGDGRELKSLTARQVETARPGKYGDGGGLQLVVSPSGSRKWVLRFLWRGKAREMGLGAMPTVGLAEAREKALAARRLVKSGVDPIADRKSSKSVPTFGEMADEVISSLTAGFRNEKHRAQWIMTMTVYAAPLRSKPVDAITTADVLAVLKPLWTRAPATAIRLRGRIERVLNAAKAKGFRSGENPAAWRGHLDHLLSRRAKVEQAHHAAMPYAEIPAFIARLREDESVAALALEFAILTAARSGEVLGMLWSELDLEARVWTIPPARMKAGREHRAPLSEPALAILAKLSPVRASEFVFPGRRSDRPLSAPALNMVLRRTPRQDGEAATVHGMRSAFRDWVGNETHFPREVAEAALAHQVGNAVEQAYRRSDALEKRRALMAAWGSFCEPDRRGDVIELKNWR